MSARPAAASAPPEAIIEAYVLDVVRRLPRRQRNDVGVELRNLLAEGLRDRAGDAGRIADEAMALDLVREFGRPDDVAARYHAPAAPIIPPAQGTAFAWTSFIGVGLQWAVTLPMTLSGQTASNIEPASRIGAWWVTYGLGAFWWPGFLVSIAIIAAFIRKRWPAEAAAWKPKLLDRDHVNRPMHLLGLAAALAGIALWVGHAWLVLTTDTPYSKALAFAPDFLATRAPVLLLFWAAALVMMVVVIVEGRWRKLTRQINVGLQVAAIALMSWFVLGGPLFISEQADRTAKGALVFVVLLVLIQLGSEFVRSRHRLRPPAAPNGAQRS